MRPIEKTYKISKEELDALQLPLGTGAVMILIPYKNKDQKTKSGIYLVGDEDYKPAMHAERWGYVYKMSDSLHFDRTDMSSMQWVTEIETEIGDKVWFDFRAAMYAYTYECEGEWYKIMEYQNLYIAERGKETITLNGYILFSEYEEDLDSDILLTTNIDKKYGIAEYVGSYNQGYLSPFYDDNITVEKGDHVLFESGTSCFPLEAGLHNEFSDDKFVIQQRKRIIGVVDHKHENVLSLHDNVIGVEIKKTDLDRGEIKLLKDNKDHRIGHVKVSSHPNICEGDVVVLAKKGGTIFNGLEYLTEERVLYYETTS